TCAGAASAALAKALAVAKPAACSGAVRKLIEAVKSPVAVIFLFELLIALRRCRRKFQLSIIAAIGFGVRCTQRRFRLICQVAERSFRFLFAAAAATAAAFVVIFFFDNFFDRSRNVVNNVRERSIVADGSDAQSLVKDRIHGAAQRENDHQRKTSEQKRVALLCVLFLDDRDVISVVARSR